MRFPFLFRQERLTKAPRRSRSSRQIGRAFEQLEDRRLLATLPVTLVSDAASPVGDGEITLREAISYVNGDFVPVGDRSAFDFNNLGTNDKITFESTNPLLNGGTILLTEGELDISESATIDASMLTQGLTINAGDGTDNTRGTGDGFRIFNITGTGLVTLDSLTLTGADVAEGNGSGGAIRTTASLTVLNSTIDNNHASSGGGGVAIVSTNASHTFLFTNTTFSNNTTGFQGNGGGLLAELQGGSLTIEDSTFHMNTADDSGGGIASSTFTPYALAA